MLSGVPVHAIQRGNNRSNCFSEDEDRQFFLVQLGRLIGEERCALHAYCLMTNHVHLLLTPQGDGSCARFFKRLGLIHTQYTNRKYRRTGTLWEGRFRSCLVQSEGYLLACYRYIELNPVRAGIVSHPGAYPWSSYRMNAEGAPNSWVTPHPKFLCLGRNESERREEYRESFGSHVEPDLLKEIRAATNGGFALGNEAFRREMERALGRRVVKGSPGRRKCDLTPGRPERDLFPV